MKRRHSNQSTQNGAQRKRSAHSQLKPPCSPTYGHHLTVCIWQYNVCALDQAERSELATMEGFAVDARIGVDAVDLRMNALRQMATEPICEVRAITVCKAINDAD